MEKLRQQNLLSGNLIIREIDLREICNKEQWFQGNRAGKNEEAIATTSITQLSN